jgi:hypothetical protein
MKNLNLYNIKLEWNVEGDEEPSYSNDQVLAPNAEDAVGAAKERLLAWEIKENGTNVKKIEYIRLHECKLDSEDIDIVSKRMAKLIDDEIKANEK